VAIDAGTAALIGVGATATAALLGVVANLRTGKATTELNRQQLERQAAADVDAERDRGFQRLERENDRLNEVLAAERASHAAERVSHAAELARAREENAQLRAENLTLSVGLMGPAPPPRKSAKAEPPPRRGRKP
jgi:hypothetical protein